MVWAEAVEKAENASAPPSAADSRTDFKLCLIGEHLHLLYRVTRELKSTLSQLSRQKSEYIFYQPVIAMMLQSPPATASAMLVSSRTLRVASATRAKTRLISQFSSPWQSTQRR